ncbi:hypothetical protein [Zhaonella formicivorans]|uniref:hypothetical protein n=1 Tax=Zhaonella formicivorans TaxID=2528593 RepID=UPI001D122BF4|nr:hypothetical protein [Zhaonella formicivorans]
MERKINHCVYNINMLEEDEEALRRRPYRMALYLAAKTVFHPHVENYRHHRRGRLSQAV